MYLVVSRCLPYTINVNKKPTGLGSPLIYNIKDAIQKVEVPLRTYQVVQLLMADR